MRHAILISISILLVGCLPETSPECLGSDECSDGGVCRAGMCVAPRQERPSHSSKDTTSVTDTSSPTFDDAENLDSTVEATVDAAPDVEPPPCPGASVPTTGDLRINELLANPPADALGDANRDGTRDAFEDEFVEIVNVSASLLDLSQASLNVDDSVVVQFDELCVPPGEGVVVFGGFRGEGQPVVPRGSTPIVAPTRLGLSNAGAVISISLADGTTLDSVDYTDAPAESLTRAPQLRGGDFVVHSDLPGQRLMSPGICADGSLLMTRCPESEAPTSDTGPPDAGGDGG